MNPGAPPGRPDAAATPVVELRDAEYRWRREQPLLCIPHLAVAPGERVFIGGASGSGKSTLLGLVGGVLQAQAGQVTVLGHDFRRLGPSARDLVRADGIGYIFQMFNLLPYLSVLDNVLLPCRFSAVRRSQAGPDAVGEARRLLERLGLGDPALLQRRVTELSMGQQQRVAAARALIGRPRLVIADEPTSSLDADARSRFIDLLLGECAAVSSAVLFVSHDRSLAGHFGRQVELEALNRAARPEACP